MKYLKINNTKDIEPKHIKHIIKHEALELHTKIPQNTNLNKTYVNQTVSTWNKTKIMLPDKYHRGRTLPASWLLCIYMCAATQRSLLTIQHFPIWVNLSPNISPLVTNKKNNPDILSQVTGLSDGLLSLDLLTLTQPLCHQKVTSLTSIPLCDLLCQGETRNTALCEGHSILLVDVFAHRYCGRKLGFMS